MHYRTAATAIWESHLRQWGMFFQPLPSFDGLSREEAQDILLTRAREMEVILETFDNPFEITRFMQECETIALMLLLFAWGAWSDEVPITEEDLADISGTMNDLAAAGFQQEGYRVIDVTRRLVERGMKMRELPFSIPFLLEANTTQKGND